MGDGLWNLIQSILRAIWRERFAALHAIGRHHWRRSVAGTSTYYCRRCPATKVVTQ